MSVVLEQIAQVIGTPVPTKIKEILPFVRKAHKVANKEQDLWNKFTIEAQAYLNASFRRLQERAPVIVPVDFEENKFLVDDPIESTGEDEIEPVPEGFICTKTHTNYNLITLINMREQDMICLPDFQRKFIWNKQMKQGFLQSVMQDLLLHNIILAANEQTGDWVLLDGFQRLSTIIQFVNGQISLGKGVQPYSGYFFHELPPAEQKKVLNTTLTVTEVRTDKRFHSYIFRQVNKPGSPLSAMEFRRAQYDHELLVMLDEFTEFNELWLGLFGRNTRYKGLQSLLRALAMHTQYSRYNGTMDQFLDSFCDSIFIEDVRSDTGMTLVNIEQIKESLHFILMALDHKVGKPAFRLASRKPINLGMVDALIHAGFLLKVKQPKLTIFELGVKLSSIREKLINDPKVLMAFKINTSGREEFLLVWTQSNY